MTEKGKPIELMFSQKPPKPILPKKPTIEFVDLDPTEVARQLTLIDYDIYKKIMAFECIGQPWNKPNAVEKAPNVTKMIQWFNQVSSFVTTQIVLQDKVKPRAEMLGKMIKVAKVSMISHDKLIVRNVLNSTTLTP
jgi:son of sevenless-like protein